MRRRGSMLEMRGAQGSGSLSGSDNSINSAPARRSTVTRRSFGDPPPLPGKKAVILNPLNRAGIPAAAAAPPRTTTFAASAATPAASATATPTRSSPTTPPAVGGPSAPFSRVTIVHRPTKEARKAEIVAAVTKRLYTQKKKPEPGSAAWSGPWPGVGARPGEYVGGVAGAGGGALPDTNEEAEDEPKELKLCSNARAKLQEISKRALALHLHRKRRDQEAQTEHLGVLRVKEKACGPDGVQHADKACQHPHPFYLQPLWGLGLGADPLWGLAPGLGIFRQRHVADDAFSDDSLEPGGEAGASPAHAADTDPLPCGTLMRAFSLKSGGRFESPAPRSTAAHRTTSHGCQTGEPEAPRTRTADAATSIAYDAATMTGEEEEEPATRDAVTMTTDNNDKATMTVQASEAAVMTSPMDAPFKDVGTATDEDPSLAPRHRDCGTETEVRGPTAQEKVSDGDGHGKHAVQCDVRLSFQGPPTSPTCSYRLTVPAPAGPPRAMSPNVLSAGQHIPSGATDDRPAFSGKLGAPGVPVAQGAPGPAHFHKAPPPAPPPAQAPDYAAAPPDIIAEAGPGAGAGKQTGESLSAVVCLPLGSPHLHQQVFSLEIIQPMPPLSLDAHLESAVSMPPTTAPRSRSLDHGLDELPTEAPAAPAPSSEPVASPVTQETPCPPRKFRLPCLADSSAASAPRPSATARPVPAAAGSDSPPAAVPPPARRNLTPKQRRLLVNLLNVRPERRRRPTPVATQRRRPTPVISGVDRLAVLQSLTCLLGEAALYVRSARDGLSKAPTPAPAPAVATPPPAPDPRPPTSQTSSTQTTLGGPTTTSSKATQSISDASAQCSLLTATENVSTRTRASQCTLPSRATASSSTQCSPLTLRAWEDGDLTWTDVNAEDDLTLPLPPPRKAESMADLYDPGHGRTGSGLPWRSRSTCSGSLRPSRWGLGLLRPPDPWLCCPRRPLPPCAYSDHRHAHLRHGRIAPATPAVSLSSPKQYLHHLVTLRRGVVLASMETEAGMRRGWKGGRDDGRPTFPS
ncbi:uncharacterized protein LOC113207973 [Frankliniella occidentalis]|uniref:Uncharacterized protein LOC113207973 n=1 Tax=Frankliniella occidentalis TaxID=133901 RepID=A0A9C6U0D1_FRAOC|nr:uncharacterized protein LOC113207973 [Frankliniella occidentalis]